MFPPARIFHISNPHLINTGASARWKDARWSPELFQQFVNGRAKPLKRLVCRSASPHRAEAPVSMRNSLAKTEISGLAVRLTRCHRGGLGAWILKLFWSLGIGAWSFGFALSNFFAGTAIAAPPARDYPVKPVPFTAVHLTD